MMSATKSHALIVAGGGRIARDRLTALAQQADIVVAADSGLLLLRQFQIEPTIVIGDLDSLCPDDLKTIPATRIRRDTGQDDTDLEKAVRYCLKHNVCSVDIAGATGGRLDHSLNAVSMLVKYGNQLSLTLHDQDGWAERVTQSPVSFGSHLGERVSLIPAPAAFGLTSRGLRYPLDNLDLYYGSRDAISNEVVTVPAELRWREGAFLLYHQIV